MAEILAEITDMRVVQADDQMALDTNSVYTIPPGGFLGLRQRSCCALTEPVQRDGVPMSQPHRPFLRPLLKIRARGRSACFFQAAGRTAHAGIREFRGAGGTWHGTGEVDRSVCPCRRQRDSDRVGRLRLGPSRCPGPCSVHQYVQQSLRGEPEKSRTEGRTNGLEAILKFAPEIAPIATYRHLQADDAL